MIGKCKVHQLKTNKQNEVIKDRIILGIRNRFELRNEEENYY